MPDNQSCDFVSQPPLNETTVDNTNTTPAFSPRLGRRCSSCLRRVRCLRFIRQLADFTLRHSSILDKPCFISDELEVLVKEAEAMVTDADVIG